MKAGRVSFGEPVAGVKPYPRANIPVFVHVEGFDYTLAARIVDIAGTAAFGGAAGLAFRQDLFTGRQIRIRVSFVDAATGEVLCFIRPKAAGEAAFLKEFGQLR